MARCKREVLFGFCAGKPAVYAIGTRPAMGAHGMPLCVRDIAEAVRIARYSYVHRSHPCRLHIARTPFTLPKTMQKDDP